MCFARFNLLKRLIERRALTASSLALKHQGAVSVAVGGGAGSRYCLILHTTAAAHSDRADNDPLRRNGTPPAKIMIRPSLEFWIP